MKERISILGATGSIGTSALDVVSRHLDRFEIAAVSCNQNVKKLAQICSVFHPSRAIVASEEKLPELKKLLESASPSTKAFAGSHAIAQEAAGDSATVLVAIVGAAGLEPSFLAARTGKKLLLANKESVVCGTDVLMDCVKKYGARLLPVDSEHSAIFQSLEGASERSRSGARLVLTCSGGPFLKRQDLSSVKVSDALSHPTWSMGSKITIDSATLMNKGLEVIEASYLFDFPADKIDVVIHPQSIIHSLVAYEDGCVMAELGLPDMRSPISYALGYPDRIASGVGALDLAKIGTLTFEAPNTLKFPLLKLAYNALKAHDASTIVLNASNEIAVGAFLSGRIGFTDIFSAVENALEASHYEKPSSIEEILAVDREVRIRTREALRLC